MPLIGLVLTQAQVRAKARPKEEVKREAAAKRDPAVKAEEPEALASPRKRGRESLDADEDEDMDEHTPKRAAKPKKVDTDRCTLYPVCTDPGCPASRPTPLISSRSGLA